MITQLFNPFEDRLSRDIRNELSEGLADAVKTGSLEKITRIIENFRQQSFDDYYREYFEDRYARYQQALALINEGITEPIHQGVVLWNLELYFEVHEVLEHAWYAAEGDMKLILQALIRAAGVYIKREYGFNDAAGRIAAKAIPVLEANLETLRDYFNPEQLIYALKNPENRPPRLS